MPTYEYACELCGHQMEVFHSIMAEKLVTCPSCAENGLKRLIGTGAGLIFKGTGFYETDYKKKAEPAGSKSSGDSDKGGATSTSATSSASPAASPAPTPAASGSSNGSK
jgi:putative FmdB family regulatory protein